MYAVGHFVNGERVLELACGTGYWTRLMRAAAVSIHAVDLSQESIEVARRGAASDRRVTFELADLFTMAIDANRFSAVVSGFFWSHIPRQRLSGFVAGLASRLRSGTRLLFFDNRYVDGSSSPIVDTDPEGNTYQMRRLGSGDEYRILKNFPLRSELCRAVDGKGRAVDVTELQYYWILGFSV